MQLFPYLVNLEIFHCKNPIDALLRDFFCRSHANFEVPAKVRIESDENIVKATKSALLSESFDSEIMNQWRQEPYTVFKGRHTGPRES